MHFETFVRLCFNVSNLDVFAARMKTSLKIGSFLQES